jgi:hypothetical protein
MANQPPSQTVQIDTLVVRLVDTQKSCIDSLQLNIKLLNDRYTQLEDQALKLQKAYNDLLATTQPAPAPVVPIDPFKVQIVDNM